MSSNDPYADLSPRQKAGIRALLNAPTVVLAAKEVGVTKATLWRWLAQETFADALRRAQALALAQSVRALQQSMDEAVASVRDGMNEDNAPNTRLKAADIVFGRIAALYSLVEIDERLAVVERRLDNVDDYTDN